MIKQIAVPLVVAVVASAGIFFAAKIMTNPMGTDLSVVGQGRPALVLGFENYSPAGGDALNHLNDVRSSYEDRMVFVVADLGTPHGLDFARRHDLRDGVAVFLSAVGTPIEKSTIPADELLLRQQLDRWLEERVLN